MALGLPHKFRAIQAKRFRGDRVKSFIHPRQVLPSLHNKTHFKAAQEYMLGDSARTKSMRDQDGDVERSIRNAVQRIGGVEKLDSFSIRPQSIENAFLSIGSHSIRQNAKTQISPSKMSTKTGKIPAITLEEFDLPGNKMIRTDRQQFYQIGAKPHALKKLDLHGIRQLDSAAPTDQI